MRMSTTEDSHQPHGWAQSPEVATPAQGVNGGLAAIDDGNDRKGSQGFDSESHLELANRQDQRHRTLKSSLPE